MTAPPAAVVQTFPPRENLQLSPAQQTRHPFSLRPLPERHGKVKWYDADKRVGFLTRDDGGEVLGSTFIFLVVSQAKVVIYLDDESDQ